MKKLLVAVALLGASLGCSSSRSPELYLDHVNPNSRYYDRMETANYEFSKAFVLEPRCSGLVLHTLGKPTDGAWLVDNYIDSGTVIGGSPMISTWFDAKTAEEAALKVCSIIKQKGGRLA
jgi:hypothetical protein